MRKRTNEIPRGQTVARLKKNHAQSIVTEREFNRTLSGGCEWVVHVRHTRATGELLSSRFQSPMTTRFPVPGECNFGLTAWLRERAPSADAERDANRKRRPRRGVANSRGYGSHTARELSRDRVFNFERKDT